MDWGAFARSRLGSIVFGLPRDRRQREAMEAKRVLPKEL